MNSVCKSASRMRWRLFSPDGHRGADGWDRAPLIRHNGVTQKDVFSRYCPHPCGNPGGLRFRGECAVTPLSWGGRALYPLYSFRDRDVPSVNSVTPTAVRERTFGGGADGPRCGHGAIT